MTTVEKVTVPADDLRELIAECFENIGIRRDDAVAVGDALVYANLREIDSHGFERVPIYMRRVQAGLSGGTDRMTVVFERGALCCLDAAHGLGPAVGRKACARAAALARKHGVGLVSVRNSTNFGAAGFYALELAHEGLIGIATTNAPKMMAPHGAAEPFLGSNPIAIAIPLGGQDEFVLDMSTTIVARGKIRRAKMLGEPIPPGLALNESGRDTTDPAEALAGTLMPLGGPKGSGLALAVTLLLGLVAGAEFDDEVASIYGDGDRAQNLGQLFLAIEPSGTDPAEWDARVSNLIERLRRLRPAPGVDEVQYPGARSAARARGRQAEGIPIAFSDIDEVANACRECGADALAEKIAGLREIHASTEVEVQP